MDKTPRVCIIYRMKIIDFVIHFPNQNSKFLRHLVEPKQTFEYEKYAQTTIHRSSEKIVWNHLQKYHSSLKCTTKISSSESWIIKFATVDEWKFSWSEVNIHKILKFIFWSTVFPLVKCASKKYFWSSALFNYMIWSVLKAS